MDFTPSRNTDGDNQVQRGHCPTQIEVSLLISNYRPMISWCDAGNIKIDVNDNTQ